MIKFIRIFSLISILVGVFGSCKKEPTSVHVVKITEPGILDLRGLNYNLIDPIPLAGIWDAFPGKLPITEAEFLALENEKPVPLAIPGYWVNQNLPAHGYVTYRLKLLVDEPGPVMLYLREASSAYKIFAWNTDRGLYELGSSGKLATNKEDSIGYYTETARTFRAFKGTILYLQVSNYLYSRGGAYYSPMLGGTDRMQTFLKNKERKKLFFVGVFSILFLYHFVLFLHRRKDKFTLFYSLICLAWLVRILLFERITRDWFEPSDFMEMLQIRLEYLAFMSMQFFAIQYFYTFFSPYIDKKIKNIFLLPIVIFIAITILTPYSIYTKILQITQGYMVIILGYSFYAVVRSLQEKNTRYPGVVFLLGTATILYTTIFDSIVFLKRLDLPFLTDFGFTLYSVCLAVVIASRNSYAWETAEYLTLNLRNEVDWKTIELRREKERAEKASELKDKFISIVSHDIRSPLFGISSVVNLLTEAPSSMTPEKAKQVLSDASSGLKNLLSMVEELIQYSRFQNATIFPDYQLFDFNQIIDAVMEKAGPLTDAKRISFEVESGESSVGIGDPHLIQHLLWNFITNAIKFTPKEGKIQVILKDTNSHWRLSVVDSGIGFPESWQEKIFDEGYLFLRKGTDDEMGAGVGLAFCKEVCERHGGILSVTSKEGQGSTFEFSLPNYDKVVMILDDNPGYRKQLRKILKDFPCVIWEEEYPDHALQSITKLKPDLVLVDYSMPEKDGLTFLRELYANPDMIDIKTLMLSSSQSDPNTGKKLELEVLESGGDSFLRKTVPDEKMIFEIKRLLELN
jgi:signal transduction histidine kinase